MINPPEEPAADAVPAPEWQSGMHPATRTEVLRLLEAELMKDAQRVSESHRSMDGPGGSGTGEGIVRERESSGPGALSRIPRPRHMVGGSRDVVRVQRLPPLEHWALQLFGLGRSILSAALVAVPPAERDAWWDQLLAERRRQHERRDNPKPGYADD